MHHIAAVLLLAVATAAHGQIRYRTAVLTGDSAPGALEGSVFVDMTVPALDDSGGIAIGAELSTGEWGYWAESGTQLRLIAREGMPAPGTGANFAKLYTAALNGNGLAVTRGRVDSGSDQYGMWAETTGALSLVARTGDPAPGVSGGILASFQDRPSINLSGEVAFHATMEAGPGGVDASNDEGLWCNVGESLDLVARKGDQPPGMTGGSFATFFVSDEGLLSENGHVAFRALVNGLVEGPDTFWAGRPGNLHLVAQTNTQAPGLPAGAKFSDFVTGPALNENGEVAFWTLLAIGSGGVDESNNQCIWSDAGGALRLIAREGDHMVGMPAETVFGSFDVRPALNGAGDLAFWGRLKEGPGGVGSSNDASIWLADPDGDLVMLAREGDRAPDTPAGVCFGDDLSRPALNGNGQVAFLAALQVGTGGVDSTNDKGIWAIDAGGNMVLVARKGDLFDVGDGDYRPIADLGLNVGSSGESGRKRSLTGAGQLGFMLTFSDGSEGIFVAQLARPWDFNDDQYVDADDIDILCANMGSADPVYDLDDDGDADADDLVYMVEDLVEWSNDASGELGHGTVQGDFNLDGVVNVTDLQIMKGSFGGVGGYAAGNANCDTVVNATDLQLLRAAYGWAAGIDPIPEPASLGMLALGGLAILRRRNR